MTILRPALLCLLLALPSGAHAQGGSYSIADEITLQNCIETVRDINTSDGANSASTRDCIGIAAEACIAQSTKNQTTLGMVECTKRETAWWDGWLNSNYTALKENLSPELFSQLRDAQRAWISYRDTSCGFQYSYWKEGTIRHIIFTGCMLHRTGARAIELAEVLDWGDA